MLREAFFFGLEVVECHRVIRLRILSAGNGTEASADSQQTPEHGGLLKRDPPRQRLGAHVFYVFTPGRAPRLHTAASLNSGARDGAGACGRARWRCGGAVESGMGGPAEGRGARREPEHPSAALQQTPSWAWARLAACRQNITDELN